MSGKYLQYNNSKQTVDKCYHVNTDTVQPAAPTLDQQRTEVMRITNKRQSKVLSIKVNDQLRTL